MSRDRDSAKERIKDEMRAWEWHKFALRDLIIRKLEQTIRDADAIARRGKLEYDTGFKPENVPIVKDRLRHWLKNSRFEFWVEWIDIPADVAAETIEKVLEGEKDVSAIYRSDRK